MYLNESSHQGKGEVCVCVQFLDYNHALAYNHKFWTFFLPCGNVKAHYTGMYRVQFGQSRIATSQIKSSVNKDKIRTKREVNHRPIILTILSAKPIEKRQNKLNAHHSTKVVSRRPSMPLQRLYNRVVALV